MLLDNLRPCSREVSGIPDSIVADAVESYGRTVATVAVLGGGVAGLSAAHELGERGFDVDVYERDGDGFGGKARSFPVPNSATGGGKPLPAEHGLPDALTAPWRLL
jgi:glycine/D-amino acid oxidase-like deaminating enzyme